MAAEIESTPPDAIVQLRVAGEIPPTLTAAALRSMAGDRNVTLGVGRPGHPALRDPLADERFSACHLPLAVISTGIGRGLRGNMPSRIAV